MPEPDSETAPMPTPERDNAPKRGTFHGLLILRGAVSTRLVRAKKLATARLRINKANNQPMLLDPWPTLRPPSLPITTEIRAYTPPSRVVSILLVGNQIRTIRTDTILRCGSSTHSITHPTLSMKSITALSGSSSGPEGPIYIP
jgi:hypothetical protein